MKRTKSPEIILREQFLATQRHLARLEEAMARFLRESQQLRLANARALVHILGATKGKK
jgi:hypothetical protein